MQNRPERMLKISTVKIDRMGFESDCVSSELYSEMAALVLSQHCTFKSIKYDIIERNSSMFVCFYVNIYAEI